MGPQLAIQVMQAVVQGKVILTEAKFIGTASNFQAEVEALLRGMQLCQSLRFTQIEAETDSKTVVNILANPTSWPWRSKHSLKKIWLLAQNIKVTVRHVYRETNTVANDLAKLASSL
ncbi:OLC1v1016863C1 [Oldenlandia corymbosa var. corymbosa]|uniref:OLC1v1016863C1 n=1 Tax=Oldenlandia corymbosa var. corymbosa TaxID=529605 RepID=A0AAV1E881_OLDCO|nr:OLC1v1016863C1 [Oldenlandia corymbosa var. corymbosa]